MVTRCHSFSFVVTRCTTLCHLLLLVVIRCHSLSFVVTRLHSLSFVVPLVVTRCTTHCHSWSLVVIRSTTRCHSLSLDVPLVCLFINDRLMERFLLLYCMIPVIFQIRAWVIALTYYFMKTTLLRRLLMFKILKR